MNNGIYQGFPRVKIRPAGRVTEALQKLARLVGSDHEVFEISRVGLGRITGGFQIPRVGLGDLDPDPIRPARSNPIREKPWCLRGHWGSSGVLIDSNELVRDLELYKSVRDFIFFKLPV